MNKVIYFTTAVSQEYFKDYLKNWTVSPNLSNQNFHNKLIRALATCFDVDVISVRSINKNFSLTGLNKLEVKENNIIWKYPQVNVSRIKKFLFLHNHIYHMSKNYNDSSVIFVDTLNLSLLKEAIKLAKKKNCKIYGVCTDNPYNISFTNSYYTNKVMKLGKSLDGYIVLTEAINKIYNDGSKPYLCIDGVSEEVEVAPNKFSKDKYIYFGGSLMKEYGVYNLIQAYKELNLKDVKLIICGHHVNLSTLNKAIKDNPNIFYLGSINYADNLSLEKGAILSVNPRPINPQIDDYSIPSKTLECLAIGSLNITVENQLLKEHYGDCIIWSKSSEVNDLKEAINKALSLSKKEKEAIIKKGKEKVMERTSLEVIGKAVHDFII